MTNENDQLSSPSTFTVDAENTGASEMPGVTKLLNRKKLKISIASPIAVEVPIEPPADKTVIGPPPQLAPILESPAPRRAETHDQAEISMIDAGSFQLEAQTHQGFPDSPTTSPQSVNTGLHPRIAKAILKVAQAKTERALVEWSLQMIKGAADPLGKGAAVVVEETQARALFLSFQAATGGKTIPQFKASATLSATAEDKQLWNGLVWDPQIVPELWNEFLQKGYLELSPARDQTISTSNRNVARAAFGVAPHQWLMLVRCGPANAARGIIAFIAPQSIMGALHHALPLITAPVLKAA